MASEENRRSGLTAHRSEHKMKIQFDSNQQYQLDAMRERMRSVFNSAIRQGVIGYRGKWVWRETQ